VTDETDFGTVKATPRRWLALPATERVLRAQHALAKSLGSALAQRAAISNPPTLQARPRPGGVRLRDRVHPTSRGAEPGSSGKPGACLPCEPSTTIDWASTHSAWAIGMILSGREPGGRKPVGHHPEHGSDSNLQTLAARDGGES
jgi:hypothetical protein